MSEQYVKKTRYNRVTNDIRMIICKKYDAGKPISIIQTDLDLPYQTIVSIVKKYKRTGIYETEMSKSGRKRKMCNADEEFIKEKISEDCTRTLQDLKGKLATDRSVNISVSTLHKRIQEFEYSFKRISLVPEARNNVKVVSNRFDYARKIVDYENEKLIFIDEMGINTSMRKRYGRAPLGQTPRKVVTSIRSKNYSICAAISVTKMLFYEISNKAYNSNKFYDYMETLMKELKDTNMTEMIIICDNVAFHKRKDIKDLVESNSHSFCFLPSYTPQLNPIEEAFSLWKGKIKSMNCTDMESLHNAIKETKNFLTSENCNAFFRHMRTFLIKALAREEF